MSERRATGSAGFLDPRQLFRRRPPGGQPHRRLVQDYADDLRLFPSWWARGGLLVLVALYVLIPSQELLDDAWLRTFVNVGIFAIGAIGLNLLTGYTGQVSLGHAFFVGVGSYAAAYLGAEQGWPFLVYLPAAALIGFLLGALIGPFALRLRGNYLVIVTLGLLFVGRHVFLNWDSVTGGNRGVRLRDATVSIGPLDFTDLEIAGRSYSREAAFFWLTWALVAVAAIVAKNLVRGRMGRAMQATRDRDLSAEVIGVDLARTKVAAFAWSSAYACVSGVLSALLVRQAGADDFGLFLSITFVAIVIIGGAGTIFGSILGALFVVGGRDFIGRRSDTALLDPIITTSPGDPGWLSVGELNAVLFGLFIILFLMLEPRGLAALWLRVKAWFRSWPFSY
ncbi:MAG: branched-chain amino acid ABC transporter permease [Actinomycetota bacterium]|nr:branched-chain amino acid ABC transporter permease [Actinomycetota bacterium]